MSTSRFNVIALAAAIVAALMLPGVGTANAPPNNQCTATAVVGLDGMGRGTCSFTFDGNPLFMAMQGTGAANWYSSWVSATSANTSHQQSAVYSRAPGAEYFYCLRTCSVPIHSYGYINNYSTSLWNHANTARIPTGTKLYCQVAMNGVPGSTIEANCSADVLL